jgi:hypothetical protein
VCIAIFYRLSVATLDSSLSITHPSALPRILHFPSYYFSSPPPPLSVSCPFTFFPFPIPPSSSYLPLSLFHSLPPFYPLSFPPLTPFPPFLPLTLPALPCLYLSMQAIEEDSSCADFYHNRALAYEKLGDDDYYFDYDCDEETSFTAPLRLHAPLLPPHSYSLILTSATHIHLSPLALLLPNPLFLPPLPSTF